MPNFIATAFYTRLKAGWSENYFMTVDAYATAMSQLQTINTDRLGLAEAEVKCDGLRVSNVEVTRDSLVAAPITAAGTLVASGNTTQPELVIQVRFVAGFLKRAIRGIRCFPEDMITDGQYTPSAPFTTAVELWATGVVGFCSISSLNPPASRPPKFTFTPLTGFTVEGLSVHKVGRPFGEFRGRRVIR